MSRIYAVVSITYQYNDEFYWTDGYNQKESYKLEQVFSNKERADAVCLQKNREAFIEKFGDYEDLGEWIGGCNAYRERLFDKIDEKADKALWKSLEVCGVEVKDIKPKRINTAEERTRRRTESLKTKQPYERLPDVYDTAHLLTNRLRDAHRVKNLSDELLDQIRLAMGLTFYNVVESSLEDT